MMDPTENLSVLCIAFDYYMVNSGTGRTIKNICRGLEKVGVEIYIQGSIPTIDNVKRLCGGKIPSLIFSQAWATGMASMLALELNIPFVMNLGGPNQYECFFLQRNFPVKPSVVLAPSKHIRDTVLANDSFADELVKVVNPLIFQEDVVHPRSIYNKTHYTLIASEPPIKGIDMFIRIANALPNKQFIFVGPTKDLDLPDNVQVRPRTENVWEIYEDTRILLMPSKAEAFGRTSKEIIMNGLPVIASDLPGIHEASMDTAIFVQNREDLDEWLEKIEYVENNYERVCEKCRETAELFKDLDEVNTILVPSFRKAVEDYEPIELTTSEIDLFKATSYWSCKSHKEAILSYRSAIYPGDLSKGQEYYAWVESAKCELLENNTGHRTQHYLQMAMLTDSERWEAPMYLMRIYRSLKQYRSSYELGKKFYLQGPPDKGTKYEPENYIYNWAFYDELATNTYHVADVELFDELTTKAIQGPGISTHDKNRIILNRGLFKLPEVK